VQEKTRKVEEKAEEKAEEKLIPENILQRVQWEPM
jgi:hypothetical protein